MSVYGLSEKLKQLREGRGLTQQQVSELTGIARTSIQSYESNANSPSIEALVSLATKFNVSCDYLLGVSDKKEIILDDFSPEKRKDISNMIDNMMDSLRRVVD